MKTNKTIHIILFLSLLFSGWAGFSFKSLANRSEPEVVTSDSFGYTSSVTSETWFDATSGMPVCLDCPDDFYYGTISLGFNFKFYENSYNQVYLSTNGILTFGSGSSVYWNRPIPFTPQPNNMIAPFWADLMKGTYGSIYYRVIGSAPTRTAVFEWKIYSDVAHNNLVTNFEIQLFETSNDIVFQYNVLDLDYFPDSYSVGIEDSNGLNGLQYSNVLATGQDIHFYYPPASYRLNIVPRFQGGFVSYGQAIFGQNIINNGDLGQDTYNLQVLSSDPQWTAQLLDASGATLADTNSDGIVDTGTIQQGAYKTILLKVLAPVSAIEGAYTTYQLITTSLHNPAKSITTTIQSAVPVQFSQLYVDAGFGIRLGEFWDKNQINWPVQEGYTGSNLSVEAISINNYLSAWEYLTVISSNGRIYEGVTKTREGRLYYHGEAITAPASEQYTDIRYRIIGRASGAGSEQVLTNGSQIIQESDVVEADARTPVIVPSGEGKIGMVWGLSKRRWHNNEYQYNSNIILAALNNDGELLTDYHNVTNDPNWYTISHDYSFPYLAITDDLHYVVCWVDQSDTVVRCGIHTLNGNTFTRQGSLVAAVDPPSGGQPLDITLTALADNRVMLTYSEAYISASSNIAYVILNSDGSIYKSRTLVTDGYGSQPRALQFVNQNILIAWIAEDGRIGYQFLDNSYNPIGTGASYLEKVNQRNATSLSVTLDVNGRGVVTWSDGDDGDAIFYALLNSDVTLLTPPLMVISGHLSDPMFQTSDYGLGNAQYLGIYEIFLPITTK